MTDERIIKASFASYQPVKSRGVLRLDIEVPHERAKEVFDILGIPQFGQEIPVAIAVLNSGHDMKAMSRDGGEADKRSTPEPSQASGEGKDKPRRRFHELSRREQAVLLSQDERFQKWVCPRIGLSMADEGMAAASVRQICAVQSRRDLDTHPGAAQAWDRLYSQYLKDTGMVAELR